MRVIRQTMIAAALAAFTSTAAWAQPEFCNFTNQLSDTPAAATTVTCNLTGGYTLGSIDWDGFATTINAGTWGSELRVDVSGPLGSGQLQLGTGNAYAPGAQFTGSSNLFDGAGDPAGLWTFDFRESFDDGSDGLADANWDTIDLQFNETNGPPPPPATVADLGDYDPNGPAQKWNGTLAAASVDWVSFNIVNDGTRIELNTSKTFTIPFESRLDDSEIGLYDSLGNRIANNDDISFPSNPYSRLVLTLDAGTYYVAVGGFNTVFNNTGWDAASSSPANAGGEYWLNLTPEPGTAMLLCLGVVGLIRRRR